MTEILVFGKIGLEQLLIEMDLLVGHDHRQLRADQTLVVGDERLSKPRDRAEAREQLGRLCGRTHELYSALALLDDGAVRFTAIGVARLTMRRFSREFLEAYLDRAGPEVSLSVGAYRLEGLGVQLMERVEGDHFVILGLPLLGLLAFLRDEGALRG